MLHDGIWLIKKNTRGKKGNPVEAVEKNKGGSTSAVAGESTGNWRHDLNNLIAKIRVHTLLIRLKTGEGAIEVMEALREIENSCEAASRLIQKNPQPGGQTTTGKLFSNEQEGNSCNMVGELPRNRSGRILLMDDNEGLLEGLAKILREAGYEVELALNGEDCLERFSELRESGRNVDVAILDVKIPHGLGGVETLARLKEMEPGIIAVASSGFTETDVMLNYRRHGFHGALGKPFRIGELISLLDRLICR